MGVALGWVIPEGRAGAELSSAEASLGPQKPGAHAPRTPCEYLGQDESGGLAGLGDGGMGFGGFFGGGGGIKAVGLTQGGEHPRPSAGDKDGADATEDGSADGADQAADKAGFEFAQLVGAGDEQARDGRDAAAHMVGGDDLHQ